MKSYFTIRSGAWKSDYMAALKASAAKRYAAKAEAGSKGGKAVRKHSLSSAPSRVEQSQAQPQTESDSKTQSETHTHTHTQSRFHQQLAAAGVRDAIALDWLNEKYLNLENTVAKLIGIDAGDRLRSEIQPTIDELRNSSIHPEAVLMGISKVTQRAGFKALPKSLRYFEPAILEAQEHLMKLVLPKGSLPEHPSVNGD
jgi:hypothetical protein